MPRHRPDERWLLVNFVFCHPVGHLIEALHYCHGYHYADPELRIALALNADTPTELAALCPFVSEVYPVRIDVFDAGQDLASLDAIPTGWRWVVDDARGHLGNMRQVFPGLASYYDRARARFASLGSQAGVAGEAPPASRPRARSPVSDFRPW